MEGAGRSTSAKLFALKWMCAYTSVRFVCLGTAVSSVVSTVSEHSGRPRFETTDSFAMLSFGSVSRHDLSSSAVTELKEIGLKSLREYSVVNDSHFCPAMEHPTRNVRPHTSKEPLLIGIAGSARALRPPRAHPP
jgi:hypothetical protein